MTIETVERLLARDPEAWNSLLRRVGHSSEEPARTDIAIAFVEGGSFETWVEFAEERLAALDEPFTLARPIDNFRSWLCRSVVAAYPEGDPRTWDARFDAIRTNPGEDGGLAAALELLEQMKEGRADKARLGEVELAVVAGAFTSRDYPAALEHCRQAARLFTLARNRDRANFAARRLGAAHLYLRQIDEAFRYWEAPLRERGPMFGGGGTTVVTRAPNPTDEVIDEIATIAMWASSATPEFVRAVGGLAERWDDPETADALWDRFDAQLQVLLRESRNPMQDMEVVVRQSRDRKFVDTPKRALRAYLEMFPRDNWAQRELEELDHQKDIEKLVAQLATKPEPAVAQLLEYLRDWKVDGTLGEHDLSFKVVDALVTFLAARGDERAIEVQRVVLEDKLQKYGECPAAWLEEQNLGTIYAQLGHTDEALSMLEGALAKQTAHYGEDHGATALTRRNLERLRSTSA